MDFEPDPNVIPDFSNLTDQQVGRRLIESYGLFMVTWSVLETVIQAAVMKQLGIDATKTVIITGKMQFNPRLQILIYLLKSSKASADLIKLLTKTESYAQRNVLVHGVIIVGDPRRLTFAKFDGGASIKRSFTLQDFMKHVIGLNSRIEQIQKLLKIDDSDIQLIGKATLALATLN